MTSIPFYGSLWRDSEVMIMGVAKSSRKLLKSQKLSSLIIYVSKKILIHTF